MIKKFTLLTVFFCTFLYCSTAFTQIELVPADHSVYEYLKEMYLKQILTDYNSANIPVSRSELAAHLKKIDASKKLLTKNDISLLKDYLIEFSYDVTGSNQNSESLFKSGFKNLFNDQKHKYLFSFADSNATLFLDGTGSLSHRQSNGDSIGSHSIVLGELGFRLRGTLFNSIGYYIHAVNGQKLGGGDSDVTFSRSTDRRIYAQWKYKSEKKTYDYFEGYLRYEHPQKYFALTVGRNEVYQGTGYIDRLFLSDNSVPMDFLKLDLKYKTLQYPFLYGSIRGDSLGKNLNSKNIATHRLDIKFSDKFQLGIFESVIIPDAPFSFTFLNPISFLTAAELNKASQGQKDNNNNVMLGFDFEILPVKNIGFQGSLLIDDLEFGTLFKDNSKLTNKFGLQLGSMWADAFTLPGLNLKVEYSRIDPFVYSHVTNKSQYTHWDLPLGHHLPPNSDEIAVQASYNIYSRLNLNLKYQMQRSANGIILDSLGNVLINYGGDVDNATGYANVIPGFLNGNRFNKNTFTANLIWQPIRQYFLELKYVNSQIDLISQNRKLSDSYYFVTLRVDY